MRYINGEEIKYDFTKPKTYMRPVFESLEDGHVRLHHIDVEGSMEKCTFARIGHMSNQRRRIFELEEENKKLRDYAHALEECNKEAYCVFCPHLHDDFDAAVPSCDFDFDALRAAAGMEVDE